MRRARYGMLAVGVFLHAVGCVPPTVTTTPVMVRALGVDSASLDVTLVRGIHEPSLRHCPVPCLVTLPEDTSYELTLTAPGYYPATMTLSFESVWSWKGQRGAFLDVPMLQR